MLEALLKRVNGLEKRLKDEQKSASPPEAEPASPNKDSQETTSNPEESEVGGISLSQWLRCMKLLSSFAKP